MPSILTIPNRRQLLLAYIARTSPYAWPLYDEDFAPDELCGADLAAPALLNYPLPRRCLEEMGRTGVGTPYEALVSAMRNFLTVPGASRFSGLTAADVAALVGRNPGTPLQGPPQLMAFIQCLDAVQACPKLWSVAVAKILHRKRPELVPLIDKRLRGFYQTGRSYAPLFQAIWTDLQRPQVQQELGTWTTGVQTPGSGRPLTQLRALDIIVWMHMGGTAAGSLTTPGPPTGVGSPCGGGT